MLNLPQLTVLKQFRQEHFPEAEVRDVHPKLQRASVYTYEFRKPIVIGRELYKRRPVVVMDKDPVGRLSKKLSLHVIPLSSQVNCLKDTMVELKTGEFSNALIHHATTINPDRMPGHDFITVLSDRDMAVLSAELSPQLQYNPKASPRGPFGPGTVHIMPWRDGEQRTVLILNDVAEDKNAFPVLVAPVPSLQEAENGIVTLKPRPVDYARLHMGKPLGKISLGALKRRQTEARSLYGLT